MAAYSSVLAWRIPWTEELYSVGSQSQTPMKQLSIHTAVKKPPDIAGDMRHEFDL